MKPTVLIEQEGRWNFDVSSPVSGAENAKTIAIRVEVDGPYPAMYYAHPKHIVLLTDTERAFAIEQARLAVREIIRNRT